MKSYKPVWTLIQQRLLNTLILTGTALLVLSLGTLSLTFLVLKGWWP